MPTPATLTGPRSRRSAPVDAGRGDRVSHAYTCLRSLIISGQLAPGSRLIETEIAQRLRISRTPARSALHRLQQEGYVLADESQKRVRLTVSPLTREDGQELFWIVGEIESQAAHRAAALGGEPRRRLAAELDAINDELRRRAAEPEPDPRPIFDLHTQFHEVSMERAGGPRLRMLHATVKPQAERYRRIYTAARGGHLEESLAEHDEIIRHIETGEPDAAAEAVRRNWRNAADRLGRIIDRIGERGSW
jgi:DNA-binding GntR family transcriptional regulator